MNIKKIQRTTFIFTLWTFFYLLWFEWFLRTNWKFYLFKASDWQFLFHEWWYKGWVIQGSYYWILVLSLFLFIPVWIWGFCFFLSCNYKNFVEKLFWDKIYAKKTKQIQNPNKNIRVEKKKSYLEVRPKPLSGTPLASSIQTSVAPAPDMMSSKPSASQELFMEKNSSSSFDNTYSSRELSEHFEGTSPFNQAEEDFVMPDINSAEEIPHLDEDLLQIMSKSGALVIQNPTLNNQKLDYLAVASDQIFLVLTDSEKGDWLADEERFNDEDPLWFSETSHRVSPVTLLKTFENELKNLLAISSIQTHVILVKTDGNIINAEDMLDTWRQMNVLVCRSASGMPVELSSFTETFPEQLSEPDPQTVEKVCSLVAGE